MFRQVYSYGKNAEGNTGRVYRDTLGFSEDTAKQDHKFWTKLDPNKDPDNVSLNTTKINAGDSVVVANAEGVVENTVYSPLARGESTNSNSAASAVADASKGSSVPVPGGGRISPGADGAHKIQIIRKKTLGASSR